MSKLSEADVLEGIFAIIIGTVVSQGRADKSDVNSARALMEPHLFSSGKYEGSLAKDSKREKGSNPADIFNVAISINLSPQPENKYKILYNSAAEIGGLNTKIDELITMASPFKMPQIAKILKVRDQFLNDSKEQGITFTISADGASGGDTISGQVRVDLQAQTGDEEPESILSETVSFTLASAQEESKNLESYNTMFEIANAFELKWKEISKFNDIKKKAITSAEKQKRTQLLKEMCDELLTMISQNKIDASRRIYEFLYKANDLVEVKRTAQESLDELEEMEKTIKLSASASGRNVIFKDSRKNTKYFTLRTVPRFDNIDFILE